MTLGKKDQQSRRKLRVVGLLFTAALASLLLAWVALEGSSGERRSEIAPERDGGAGGEFVDLQGSGEMDVLAEAPFERIPFSESSPAPIEPESGVEPGEFEASEGGPQAWIVQRLNRKLETFREKRNPGWSECWWLIRTAAIAELEARGEYTRIVAPTPLHEGQRVSHICTISTTPEGEGRMYCLTREEFPEYFALEDLFMNPDKPFLMQVKVPTALLPEVEGRAASTLASFR